MIKKIISVAKYEGISLDSGAFGVSIVQYWEASGSDDGICLLTLNNELGLWWD